MEAKRILITGATGLIGRALTASLEADGHTAIALSRRSATGPAWDPAAGTIETDALEGFDAVVHLAGEPIAGGRWNDERKARIRDSRIDGTTLLAETLAGLDAPPRVLLSGSAIGWYGDRGDTPLTEDEPPASTFLAQVCREWEAATAPAEAAGIRVAHLRTGIALDASDGALAKMLLLFKLGLGGKLGPGDQWWSWISIDDEVGAIRWLLDNEVAGPVNLTAPGAVTNADFTSTLGDVLGRPTVLPVPAFGPRLLLGTELADELLFTSAHVEPKALTDGGFSFHYADLEPALRAILDR